MKKIYIPILILLFSIIIAACGPTDNEEDENNGPGDVTWYGLEDTTVARGDNYDLLTDIQAIDSIEGDITDRVRVTDNGGFDTQMIGAYYIEYEVVNSSGIRFKGERLIGVTVMHNVSNGGFESMMGWTFDTPGGSATGRNINEEIVIDITDSGNEWWNIQFYHLNTYFVKGETYRLTFDAKSSTGHSISAGFEEVNNDNRMMQYGNKVMELNDDWQTYELIYTSDANVSNVKTVIYLGWHLPNDDGVHEIILDNVYIEKLDNPQNGPKFTGLGNVNLISGEVDFDPRSGVTATDSEGNEIDFEISGEVPEFVLQTSTYLVSYKAVDSEGNMTNVNRYIHMNFKKEEPYHLINDDFTQGFTGWTREINQVEGSGKATYATDPVEGSVSIKIDDPSTVGFHIQLFQSTPKFTAGETYTVTFVAKSDIARNVLLEVTNRDQDNMNITEPLTAALINEYQTFEFTFTADADYDNVKVGVLLGNITGSEPSGATVTITQFSIRLEGGE